MWIFLNDAFLSIVAPPKEEGMLLVRARARGDIERVFPHADVIQLPNRDYDYRALVPRIQVAQAMARQVMGIDYGNFKNSVAEDCRHDAYASVWGVMFNFQRMLNGDTPAKADKRPKKKAQWGSKLFDDERYY